MKIAFPVILVCIAFLLFLFGKRAANNDVSNTIIIDLPPTYEKHFDIICAVDNLDSEEMTTKAFLQKTMDFNKASLDLYIKIENEPTSNGLLLLGIESDESKELFIEICDQEGFLIGAACSFDLLEGNNYKSIQLSGLEPGEYHLYLKDKDKKETFTSFFVDRETICIASPHDTDIPPTHSFLEALSNTKYEKLDVKFTMKDGPISNSYLTFEIESKDEKKLFIEIFDEKGFSVSPICIFDITSGKNYKSVSMSALETGEYIMLIKDLDGKKIIRKVLFSF